MDTIKDLHFDKGLVSDLVRLAETGDQIDPWCVPQLPGLYFVGSEGIYLANNTQNRLKIDGTHLVARADEAPDRQSRLGFSEDAFCCHIDVDTRPGMGGQVLRISGHQGHGAEVELMD